MKLIELFRQLQGKQPEPSPVVGKFALFPDPNEQQKICDYSGRKLAEKLIDYPLIAAQVAYDILFALKDNQKAVSLLDTMTVLRGKESTANYLWLVNRLREKDKAPKEELTTFQQFCAQAGFGLSTVDAPDVAETITSDSIASTVKLHIDRIS